MTPLTGDPPLSPPGPRPLSKSGLLAALAILGLLPPACAAAQDAPASYFPRAFDEDVVLYPALTATQRTQLIEDLRQLIRHQEESIEVYEKAVRQEGVDRQAEIARARATILDAARRISALAAARAKAALRVAARGQAADIGALRADITIILEAARANQLLGNSEGEAQQAEAMRVVRVFIAMARGPGRQLPTIVILSGAKEPSSEA